MSRPVNAHSHVFTGLCAPDFFLRTALPRFLRPWSDPLKKILANPIPRRILRSYARLLNRPKLQRYAQFLDMGVQETQEHIFLEMRKAYQPLPGTRFIALTLNMDHMGTWPSHHGRIEDQLVEVEQLRSHYPDELFPFISVDPRHLGGQALVEWVRPRFERRAFFGIKLYPSMGWFPFDERLDALYAWAEAHEVPVMTHCTRHGVHYLGPMRDVLSELRPAGLNPQDPGMIDIHKRIEAFRKQDLTWNDAKHGCNIFLHPLNYIPVLNKYPRLKICFAHFGGEDEMLDRDVSKVRRSGIDKHNWHTEVVRILSNARWPETRADISFSLHHKEVYPKLRELIGGPLGGRILFGTDYYMTLRKASEDSLVDRCMEGLGRAGFQRIACDNTATYLRSAFFDPAKGFV